LAKNQCERALPVRDEIRSGRQEHVKRPKHEGFGVLLMLENFIRGELFPVD
jgi:hypothetical protein